MNAAAGAKLDNSAVESAALFVVTVAGQYGCILLLVLT